MDGFFYCFLKIYRSQHLNYSKIVQDEFDEQSECKTLPKENHADPSTKALLAFLSLLPSNLNATEKDMAL